MVCTLRRKGGGALGHCSLMLAPTEAGRAGRPRPRAGRWGASRVCRSFLGAEWRAAAEPKGWKLGLSGHAGWHPSVEGAPCSSCLLGCSTVLDPLTVQLGRKGRRACCKTDTSRAG